MVNQIMISFLLMLVGMICYKCKIISNKTNEELTNFVLTVANPALIINSYQIEYSSALVHNILISFGLSVLTHAIMIGISSVVIGKKQSEWSIERFSLIYSNCGFIGIPLVQSMFGAEGVIYVTSYITVFNLLVWTQGVRMFAGAKKEENVIKTIVTTPALIAVFIGLILFGIRIQLPVVVSSTIEHLGNLNTPLAMVAAGVSVMQADIGKALKNIRNYYLCFWRLLCLPLICYVVIRFLPVEDIVLQTILLAAACPTGTTGIMFAIKYKKNDAYASGIVAMTTVLSLITLPLVFYCCTKF